MRDSTDGQTPLGPRPDAGGGCCCVTMRRGDHLAIRVAGRVVGSVTCMGAKRAGQTRLAVQLPAEYRIDRSWGGP